MFIWLILEVYVAILCASAPALKPLYVLWIQTPVVKTYASYRIRSKQSRADTNDPSLSWNSYTSKQSQKGFRPLDSKGNEMSIFVRSDIEMASEARWKPGDTSDDENDLGLPRHNFEAFPVPPQGRSFHAR